MLLTATPTVKSASRTVIDNGRMASNYFFTSYQENDSILGLAIVVAVQYRMNVETGEMIPHRFDSIVSSQTANDILLFTKTQKVIG